MKTLLALLDYKSKFGSKHFDIPYRSGMDKNKLSKYFLELGIQIEYKFLNEIDFKQDSLKDKDIIYTSSEDTGYQYKSYIEDMIYALELSGANVIPSYRNLRMNNNKVFMEMTRDYLGITNNVNSTVFGSLKDLKMKLNDITFPIVFKASAGASGTGVALVENKQELINNVNEICKRNL